MGRGRATLLLVSAGLAAVAAVLAACDDTAPSKPNGTGDNLTVDVDATVQPQQPRAQLEGGIAYGYSDGSLDGYAPLE
jgi:hypothetical protein